MDAVTYPEKSVIDFVNSTFIPLRIPSNSEPLATEFRIKWTPALILLDASGKESWRTVGFLPAGEFIPAMYLGIAKVRFDADQFPECLKALETIIVQYANSDSAAEALFWKGVAGYKGTHDPKPLRRAYDRLAADYPTSKWARHALPYRLIPL